MTEVDPKFATSAGKEFCAQTPEYVPTAANSKRLTAEVVRLYEEEGASPEDIQTFNRAFANVRHELILNELPEKKPYADMSPEELTALPEKEKDQLPARDLKRLAEFELRQQWVKPEQSDEQKLLIELFGDWDFAFSPLNASIVKTWVESRGLAMTPQNITSGIIACQDQLEFSQTYLNSLSADQYRKQHLDPLFKKELAKQPKRESSLPIGIKSYTDYLHSR